MEAMSFGVVSDTIGFDKLSAEGVIGLSFVSSWPFNWMHSAMTLGSVVNNLFAVWLNPDPQAVIAGELSIGQVDARYFHGNN